MKAKALCWVGLGLALVPALVLAQPHRPTNDSIVVETLPIRYDPALAALAAQRRQIAQQPRDLTASMRLATSYIEAARRDADPRFLGYAETVLAPWPAGSLAPVEVRVLRATILQSQHRFDSALAELDAVLGLRPRHAQALLTRATVLQVRGRYAEAQRDCSMLLSAAGEVSAALCLASVASVTGRLPLASSLAARARADTPDGEVPLKVWAHTLQGEIASRQDRLRAAVPQFEQALRLDPADRYARAALCDAWLDLGQPQRVLGLTADQLRDDNLLLRRALALQELADQDGQRVTWRGELATAIGELRERHLAAERRGDRTHLREAARMQLHLLHDPAGSLRLARANWEQQREPADARIMLEAAVATHDFASIALIDRWMRSTHLADAKLASLLASGHSRS